MLAYLPLIAASIYIVLGLLHLGYTLLDMLTKPRFFRPRDAAVLEGMRQTTAALAPGGRDYWTATLGFHLSHSIGALLLALLIVVSLIHEIGWLVPVLTGISALYALIAWRCWFNVPAMSCTAATALLGAGLLS